MPRWRELPQELDPRVREFTERLREIIEDAGLSAATVAETTGHGRAEWGRYLSGGALPPRAAVSALAKATGADPRTLAALREQAEYALRDEEPRHDRAATPPRGATVGAARQAATRRAGVRASAGARSGPGRGGDTTADTATPGEPGPVTGDGPSAPTERRTPAAGADRRAAPRTWPVLDRERALGNGGPTAGPTHRPAPRAAARERAGTSWRARAAERPDETPTPGARPAPGQRPHPAPEEAPHPSTPARLTFRKATDQTTPPPPEMAPAVRHHARDTHTHAANAAAPDGPSGADTRRDGDAPSGGATSPVGDSPSPRETVARAGSPYDAAGAAGAGALRDAGRPAGDGASHEGGRPAGQEASLDAGALADGSGEPDVGAARDRGWPAGGGASPGAGAPAGESGERGAADASGAGALADGAGGPDVAASRVGGRPAGEGASLGSGRQAGVSAPRDAGRPSDVGALADSGGEPDTGAPSDGDDAPVAGGLSRGGGAAGVVARSEEGDPVGEGAPPGAGASAHGDGETRGEVPLDVDHPGDEDTSSDGGDRGHTAAKGAPESAGGRDGVAGVAATDDAARARAWGEAVAGDAADDIAVDGAPAERATATGDAAQADVAEPEAARPEDPAGTGDACEARGAPGADDVPVTRGGARESGAAARARGGVRAGDAAARGFFDMDEEPVDAVPRAPRLAWPRALATPPPSTAATLGPRAGTPAAPQAASGTRPARQPWPYGPSVRPAPAQGPANADPADPPPVRPAPEPPGPGAVADTDVDAGAGTRAGVESADQVGADLPRGPAAGGEPVPPGTRWHRLGMFAAGVVGTLLVVAAVVLIFDVRFGEGESRRAEPVATPSVDLPEGVRCTGAACGGKDPEAMGCGGEHARTAADAVVGGVYVEVRYSEVCGAAWARIARAGVGDEVRVRGDAKGAQGGQERDAKADAAGDGYTAMVPVRSAAQATACVTRTTGEAGCTSS
ncbi:DUF2690 domain-containing protein [Streptomyces sp. NPDC057702]|uniref:DUF2690 domain-containing protein n=1 Tax=unclassified Streptomyces TaxID=2593676 RepID=UPI0036C55B60